MSWTRNDEHSFVPALKKQLEQHNASLHGQELARTSGSAVVYL
jgi:hypothetical protein